MQQEKKQFALGRGLSSLIPSKFETPGVSGERVVEIDVNQVSPNPHQPRTEFSNNHLDDLVESIREHGILQPLIVTEGKTGFQLIAGERRLRAAKKVGLKKVPVIIRRASEQQKLELAIVENVQRSDLNPVERALGYKKLMDEFQLRQEDVAKKVGQKRPSIANTLRILTLPENIIQYLNEGRLTEGHAKVILSLDTEDLRQQMVKKILLHNLSVRETENAIGIRRGSKQKKTNPALKDIEDRLQHSLATKVSVTGKRSYGKIVIEYYSEEELDSLMSKLT